MSIRYIKAVRRYYVVSTGWTEADFIVSGKMSPRGTIPTDTEWPAGATISWCATKEQQQNHPANALRAKSVKTFTAQVAIDSGSGVAIAATHAAKATEARLVKFDGVTDPAQLPYIDAEMDLQPTKTMQEIADEIWTEHIGVAGVEAKRTHNKRIFDWRTFDIRTFDWSTFFN